MIEINSDLVERCAALLEESGLLLDLYTNEVWDWAKHEIEHRETCEVQATRRELRELFDTWAEGECLHCAKHAGRGAL
jgi:hypothetical protein